MSWQEAVRQWRVLFEGEQRHIGQDNLPRKVARSMAFGGKGLSGWGCRPPSSFRSRARRVGSAMRTDTLGGSVAVRKCWPESGSGSRRSQGSLPREPLSVL